MMMINRKFLHETLHDNIDKIIKKHLGILGCGALGANLAISLARRGFSEFWLVDYDKIEDHNISTQPWHKEDLGRRKVDTLATELYRINQVQALTDWKGIASTSDILNRKDLGWTHNIDLFIDCFDNSKARQAAQGLYPKHHVLHVGMSNQNTGEVTWDYAYTIPPDITLDDPCNYPLSRTLIELTVVVSSEAIIAFLKTGSKFNYFINANNLKIEERTYITK